jgi:hypothetical protein
MLKVLKANKKYFLHCRRGLPAVEEQDANRNGAAICYGIAGMLPGPSGWRGDMKVFSLPSFPDSQ